MAKYYQADKQKTILDLSKPDEGLALAEKERLAEDLRLLYVALTRAVYGCIIGLAPLKKGNSKKDESTAHLSALGAILQHHQAKESAGLMAACQQLVNDVTSVEMLDFPQQPAERFAPIQTKQPNLQAKRFSASIDRQWRMTSYSSFS